MAVISKDRRSEEQWLEYVMGRMQGAYPILRKDSHAIAEYRRALMSLSHSLGRRAAEEAVDRIIDTVPNYPPSIANLRDYTPRALPKRCRYCEHTYGFVYVVVSGEKNPRMRRCDHAGG